MRPTVSESFAVRRPHTLGNFPALLPLDDGNVALALQVEPELRQLQMSRFLRPTASHLVGKRYVAEIATELHRRVGTNLPSPVENADDAPGRHTDVERQVISTRSFRRANEVSKPEIRIPQRREFEKTVIMDSGPSAESVLGQREALIRVRCPGMIAYQSSR